MSQSETLKKKVVRLTSSEERVIKFLRSSNTDMVSNALTSLERLVTPTNHIDFAVDLLSAYRGEVALHTLENFIIEGKITRSTFDSLVSAVLAGENVLFLTDSETAFDGRNLIQMVLNTVVFSKNQIVYIDKAPEGSILSPLIYSKDYLSSDRDVSPYENLSNYTGARYRFTNVVEETVFTEDMYKMYQQNMFGHQTIVNYSGVLREDLVYSFVLEEELNLPVWGTDFELKYNIVTLDNEGQYVIEKKTHRRLSRHLV